MANAPLILGVGNPLFGDDGFGVEVVRQLTARGSTPGFDIEDGGTGGIYLLPLFEDRPKVFIVDAVDFGGEPGQMIRLRADQLPRRIKTKLSEHQVTLQEVLGLLDLMDRQPGEIELLGVQPRSLTFAEPLSEEVAAAVPKAIAAIEQEASRWH